MSEWQHRPSMYDGSRPLRAQVCLADGQLWPCDAEQMRLARDTEHEAALQAGRDRQDALDQKRWAEAELDAERARTVVLSEVFEDAIAFGHNLAMNGLGHTARDWRDCPQRLCERARTALEGAVLPVDRVGVEPLDVAAGKADWGPLGESGVGVVANLGLNVERLAHVLRAEPYNWNSTIVSDLYAAARLIESPTEGETV